MVSLLIIQQFLLFEKAWASLMCLFVHDYD